MFENNPAKQEIWKKLHKGVHRPRALYIVINVNTENQLY